MNQATFIFFANSLSLLALLGGIKEDMDIWTETGSAVTWNMIQFAAIIKDLTA